MHFVGIVETILVSGIYYIVGGSEGCRTNDDIAFMPLREHSVQRLERISKAVLSYIFLWGNVFDANRGGGNTKQLWF
jgi:hypothetical protein